DDANHRRYQFFLNSADSCGFGSALHPMYKAVLLLYSSRGDFEENSMFSAFIIAASLTTSASREANTIKRDWTKEWASWAPRAKIAPKFAMEATGGREGNGALRIEGGGDAAAWGSWRRKVDGIQGGRYYRFTAHVRANGVTNPQQH